MAVLTIPDEDLKVEGETEIRAHLAGLGIGFERWDLSRVPDDAPAEAVLEAYAAEIDEMKREVYGVLRRYPFVTLPS